MIIALLGFGVDAPAEHIALAKQLGAFIGERKGTLICGGFQGTLAAGASSCLTQGGRIQLIIEQNRLEAVPIPFKPYVHPVANTLLKHQFIASKADVCIAIGGGSGSLNLMLKVLSVGKKAIVIPHLTDTYNELDEVAFLPLNTIFQEIDDSFRN